jgi:ferredoxin-NADP reductase
VYTARAPLAREADRRATITAITRATADAVTIRLRTGSIAFRAGQFVTLAVPILGRVHRRNYSVSSAEAEADQIDITVKRVPGGLVSTYLSAHAKVGDRFEVKGPHGSFVRPRAHVGPLVLIGAGSGVTPLYSILQSELARTSSIALLYGNRSAEATIFRDELAALEKSHESLRVLHALEQGTAQFSGRMDGDMITRMLDAVPFASDPDALFFLCGPAPVREAARGVCLTRGIAPSRIHEERYTTSDAAASERAAHPVTFKTSRGVVSLTLAPGQTLLDGATQAGIAAPFSCAMGGCGDCRMKLVSGEVDMEEPNCLLPSERERGEVLACVARARGECTLEVRT